MVIRFFASIRNITGVKEVEWGEPAATLGDLLYSLSEHYGPQFRGWVLEGESLGSSVMVVINGDDVRHQGGLNRQLAATDVVSILPIMAGGAPPSNQLSAFSGQLSEGTQEATTRRFGLLADRSTLSACLESGEGIACFRSMRASLIA